MLRYRSPTRRGNLPHPSQLNRSNQRPSIRDPGDDRLDTAALRRDLPLMREPVSTPDAPSSSLYSQAVKAGAHVYVSGLVGVDPSTGTLAGSTIREQTRQALANCEAVLRAADATLGDVVEVGVLLASPSDFAGMNDEYATWFPDAPPTRYVAKLGVELPGVLVSIRMTAFRR
jgi:2-iminobutanoate/2-iminopropanoate deaminase